MRIFIGIQNMVDTGILVSETTVPIGTELYTGMVFIRFSTKSLFILSTDKLRY
jgi:hypothetical protein